MFTALLFISVAYNIYQYRAYAKLDLQDRIRLLKEGKVKDETWLADKQQYATNALSGFVAGMQQRAKMLAKLEAKE